MSQHHIPGWARDAVFYHLYPLGTCGAPRRNDHASPPVPRLGALRPWLEHARDLGATAVLLGPVFESTEHGYDTADYLVVDRRLGELGDLAELCTAARRLGLRVVPDGVFHHVGRQFWAFRDLLQHGEGSRYRHWFSNVRFGGRSPLGDPFVYDAWHGHYTLVKLDVGNPEVRQHLFEVVSTWVRELGIDGLRLDAADSLDRRFQRALSRHCREQHPDLWLMGEVIHGDYRRWVHPRQLHSTTNYELYKGLWSSHVDHNYFELAHSLDRQSGPEGLYRDLRLYPFADNHDVPRVATKLREAGHLRPLYALLLTMPGIPSIYYGSEWGIHGDTGGGHDWDLRPALDLAAVERHPHPRLVEDIRRLIALRHELTALRRGDYRTVHLASEQLVFLRGHPHGSALVAVNSASRPVVVDLDVDELGTSSLRDALAPGEPVEVREGRARVELPPCWARVLVAG